VSSCHVPLSEAELKALCGGGSGSGGGSAPFGPVALPFAAVGMFGNARGEAVGEWVEIEFVEHGGGMA
jgi:hypothetical protein